MNGAWVGVVENPTDITSTLRLKRRNSLIPIFTSIYWDIAKKEIIIFTDAGRPCHPLSSTHPSRDPLPHVTTTRFDNDHSDLSDVDFLLPGEACQVLRQLGEPKGIEANQLPAHLAICVGRLLGGPDPKAISRTAMKS